MDEIEILRQNVYDSELQLNASRKRVKELIEVEQKLLAEIEALKITSLDLDGRDKVRKTSSSE